MARRGAPEILELLRLAEMQPSVPQLEPYLAHPRVRRAAIAALTETRRAAPGGRWPRRPAMTTAPSGMRPWRACASW